jgi:cytochrome b561
MSGKDRYDSVAITLHWLIAAAIVCMIVSGLVMTELPRGSTLKFLVFQWHKSVGITVLASSVVRLGWRLGHQPPPLPEDMPAWEKLAAHLTHAAFYVLMVGMPLTGWAAVSASPFIVPTMLYGVVTLPPLPILATLVNKKPVQDALEEVHSSGAWILLALLALHVAAALRHHVLLKDDTLRRMLPRFRLLSTRYQ